MYGTGFQYFLVMLFVFEGVLYSCRYDLQREADKSRGKFKSHLLKLWGSRRRDENLGLNEFKLIRISVKISS